MSAALSRILRTSSFRLTSLCSGLFVASVLILFGVTYWTANVYMSSSLDEAVDSDITELEDSLQTGGNDALIAQIKERLRQTPNGPIYYLLQDPEGKVIAGNISPARSAEGRFDLKVPRSNLPSIAVHAHGVTLPDSGYLMVGVDALARREMHKLIVRVFGWSSAVSLALAFPGSPVRAPILAHLSAIDAELAQRGGQAGKGR